MYAVYKIILLEIWPLDKTAKIPKNNTPNKLKKEANSSLNWKR